MNAAASMVRMICPNLSCRKVLSVPVSARGKSVRCRHCGMRIHVPEPRPAKPAPEEQEEPAESGDTV